MLNHARYHFHAADGVANQDAHGEELPDLQAAEDVALDVLAELLPMKRRDFWAHKVFSVPVKDEESRLVAVLTATATVDPTGRPDVPPERQAP